MHHETFRIVGNWSFGIALDHHNVAHAGTRLTRTRVADMLLAARTDTEALETVAMAAARRISGRTIRLAEYDAIVPVPPSRRLGPARDGDLVHDVAAATARLLGVDLLPCLETKRSVVSLKGVEGKEERAARRRDLYRLSDPALVKGRRILVLNDVVMTGATLEAAVETVLTGSPLDVHVLALTAAGGVDRSRTLQDKALDELSALYEEMDVGDDEVYLTEGESLRRPGT